MWTCAAHETCEYIESCLTELITEIKYSTSIKTKQIGENKLPARNYGIPCQICGERRVYNMCHVIPKSEGGSYDQGNIIYLCPTHHFLFDHARLSKAEFNKIYRISLSSEAREYLETIHSTKHEVRWKYLTNNFNGCTCGSKDFHFEKYRAEKSVEVVLRCDKCNELWMNCWEELHPISRLKLFISDFNLNKEEIKNILDDGELKIDNFLQNELSLLLSSNEW
ncbi:MAG: HNH endonuclease [candidate division Zixibacteria bacterium]|nr:HNH endonuclease [candidate division Zixibacteria bacterium]